MSVRHIYNARDLDTLFSVYKHSTLAVNFYTEWSAQSQIASKEFECLCQNPVCNSLVLAHCHAEIHPDISQRFGVNKVPTLLFLKQRKVIDRLEGFDPYNMQKKLLHHASKQYQCSYHLNATPEELCTRIHTLLHNTDMILFVNNFHSSITWKFYAMLDGMCATYEVFNVCQDLAVQAYLKNCWNITTYPQLFMFGCYVGDFHKVRHIKTDKRGGKYLRKAIKVINKRRTCGTDPVAFAAYRVRQLLQRNNIVVFLEEDDIHPCSCETRQVLEILHDIGVSFATLNVLPDIYVRRKVQQISQRSCFPQVFINGHYVGSVRFLKEFKDAIKLEFAHLNKNKK